MGLAVVLENDLTLLKTQMSRGVSISIANIDISRFELQYIPSTGDPSNDECEASMITN